MTQIPEYPLPIHQALAPITAVSAPEHQGMTSRVTFAETGLGPVAVKHAVGHRTAAVRREKILLDALRGTGLPVPECLLHLETETASGPECWLVMRRLPGGPLHHVLQNSPVEKRMHLLTQLGQLLARLHAHAIPPALAAEPGNWLDAMLQSAESARRIGLWEGTPADLEWLDRQRPTPAAPNLIHGDLFLDNVLSDGESITGLIDWAFGAVGDPRYDLALAADALPDEERAAFLTAYGQPEGLTPFETAYFMKLAAFM